MQSSCYRLLARALETHQYRGIRESIAGDDLALSSKPRRREDALGTVQGPCNWTGLQRQIPSPVLQRTFPLASIRTALQDFFCSSSAGYASRATNKQIPGHVGTCRHGLGSPNPTSPARVARACGQVEPEDPATWIILALTKIDSTNNPEQIFFVPQSHPSLSSRPGSGRPASRFSSDDSIDRLRCLQMIFINE